MQTVLAELEVEQPCMLTDYPRSGAGAVLVERKACNICFLDVATNSERAELVIAELAPFIPVVALHPRNDADLILRCLRAGASEFVAEPSPDTVRGVLDRLARARFDAAQYAAGAVYCVAPGKPGCGASTLAVHLAIQLRSGGANPVLLVDGDHLTASIAFMLKLKPEFHLEDVVRDWARIATAPSFASS
jgi:Flp pilus assembly CpaE family ATPase